MNNLILQESEKFQKTHKRKKRRLRILFFLAAVVVFCTTYALILPAITIENKCSISEHTHQESCYTQIPTNEKQVLDCVTELLYLHKHTEACYKGSEEPICGQADYLLHHHDSLCYDENGELICTLPENEKHTHIPYTSKEEPGCYDALGENIICAKTKALEHQHSDACFRYVKEPANANILTCTDTDKNHTHIATCYGMWVLSCGMTEHVHSEECRYEHELTQEDNNKIANVNSLIDSLPTYAEAQEALLAYEEARDYSAYADYCMQLKTVYAYYEDLGSQLQKYIPNSDKLMELNWTWFGDTLNITDSIEVYQINKYTQAATTLIHGSKVSEKISDMSFTYWDAVVVEKNSSGKLYVSQYVTADGSKANYKANTADGFVLLLYNTSTNNIQVGCEVTVDFNYKTTGEYKSEGYGKVNFSSDKIDAKPANDNSKKLSTTKGSDTKELIEVNLYDYGTNINNPYNSDNSYPGFQQDGGSKSVTKLNLYSFNFGNNITADLAAGNSNITKGSGINTTINGANSPISGAMQPTLGSDGYPALSNGNSLKYLFTQNTYATKKNKENINGLFIYHEDTGAYTFNSRENHAQFNAGNDTFTLYNQVISSNFMMYPFGNFLPFNDIVHESEQASVIDRTYLANIAASAQYKYDNGSGSEYKTLATQLTNFINLMDDEYPNGWTGADCMNEYFTVAGIPHTFSSDDALVKNIYSIDFDEPTDFYFGMEMKMKFTQPKNGLTGKDRQQPMVFYFTGDDDVWVYIDGVMFLDLSGIHRHVGGEIDFVNGVVKYYDLDVATGDVSTTPSKTVEFSKLISADNLNEKGTFKDFSSHSLNFYYIERGSGSGVCRMNFNFPLLQKNTISVTKEVSADDVAAELLGNPDFKLQALKENGTELLVGANITYSILDSAGNEIGSGTTDENGIFTIKANQTAVFNNISENAERYFIRELLDENVYTQYGQIIVDGNAQTKDNNVIIGSESFKGIDSPTKDISDGNTSFTFNNKLTTKKLGSLSITKTLNEYTYSRALSRFTFNIKLDGEELPVGTKYTVNGDVRYVEEAGIITLAPDETAVISNIIAGSEFSIQEINAAEYAVKYKLNGEEQPTDGITGIIEIESKAEIEVINNEKGVSINIPIYKTLQDPDGNEHTYIFKLEQIQSKDDSAPTTPAFIREISIPIKSDTVSGQFIIDYPKGEQLQQLPQTFYYKITEQINPDEPQTDYDSSVYIIEVTVMENDDETLSANITNIWKDGEAIITSESGTSTISFTNKILRYELPNTGHAGILPYVIGGAVMTIISALLLIYNRKRAKVN